jgi:hypothetical protein
MRVLRDWAVTRRDWPDGSGTARALSTAATVTPGLSRATTFKKLV